MQQILAKKFTCGTLIRFALPTMVMMLFMSLYTIVDGIFVSRMIGTTALSATNIVYPVVNVVIAVAVMLGTGGSAVIARQLGEGRTEEAKRNFSWIVLIGVAAGFAVAVLGTLFLDPLCRMLGATPELLGYSRDYLGTLLLFAPAAILQMLFQAFFVTAGKPALGLSLTVLAGISNALLDYLTMGPLDMGIRGAALATASGYLIPAIVGVLYFLFSKNTLRFAKPSFDGRVLLNACGNGSSEMVTNISSAVITFLFNVMMLQYLGEDGVAAVTIVLYAQFLLTALYMGFSLGVAPVISYQYGSGDTGQLRKVYKICLGVIGASSVAVFAASLLLANGIVRIFTPPDSAVYGIAVRGFMLFSLSYLFSGCNIFSSALFTALSNGKVSAAISFSRTFVWIAFGLWALPQMLQADGLWLAVPLAELLTVILSVFFLQKLRARYGYAGESRLAE